jgi:hypothetical protein
MIPPLKRSRRQGMSGNSILGLSPWSYNLNKPYYLLGLSLTLIGLIKYVEEDMTRDKKINRTFRTYYME